ncbi:MAG: hypothetical protein ACK4PK_06490 [Alphaproteobacteria bacterium]
MMPKKHRAHFVFAFLFVLLVISTSSPAQQATERPLSAEQKNMLAQFLRAAFPAYTRLDEDDDSSFTPRPKERAPTARLPTQQIPAWLWEYAQREKGVPKFDAISRWAQQDISIAVGLPPPNQLTDEEHSLYDKVKPVFTQMRQSLEEATGRKLRLLSPGKHDLKIFSFRRQETEATQAKIRIIAKRSEFTPYNKFKRFGAKRGHSLIPIPIQHDHPGYNLGYVERFMWDAVRFTPRARAQVEGYFVTDKDNNIEFAVCYLWPQHGEKLLQTLIAECLLRAMGLPEMTLKDKNSLLGHWNAAHDGHSRRFLLDGAYAKQPDPDHIEAGAMRSSTHGKFPHEITNEKNLPPLSMSAHDKAMLNMLYCRHLKSGMGRYETVEMLMQHKDDCLWPNKVQQSR